MTNEQAKKAIKQILASRVVAYRKIFTDVMGDVAGGVWLSQMLFYYKNRDGYVPKSKTEWEEETGLTGRQVRRIEQKAEKMGIVDTQIAQHNGRDTRHYILNMDALVDEFLKLPPTKRKGSPNETQDVTYSKDIKNKHAPEKEKTDWQAYLNEGSGYSSSKPPPKVKLKSNKTLADYPPAVADLLIPFCKLFRNPYQDEKKQWIKQVNKWVNRGYTPKQVYRATRHAKDEGTSIKQPASVDYAFDAPTTRTTDWEDDLV